MHVGSATLDPVPQLAARLGSNSARLTRLGMDRLAADDVVGGSHCVGVSADWTLTWHADVSITSWAMLLYMMMSQLHHANVIPDMSTVHDDVT